MEVNNKSLIKDQICIGSRSIPIKIVNKIMNSICKIIIKCKIGNGFFMNMSDSL